MISSPHIPLMMHMVLYYHKGNKSVVAFFRSKLTARICFHLISRKRITYTTIMIFKVCCKSGVGRCWYNKYPYSLELLKFDYLLLKNEMKPLQRLSFNFLALSVRLLEYQYTTSE